MLKSEQAIVRLLYANFQITFSTLSINGENALRTQVASLSYFHVSQCPRYFRQTGFNSVSKISHRCVVISQQRLSLNTELINRA